MDTPLALVLETGHARAPEAMAGKLQLDQLYREHFAFVYRAAVRLAGPSAAVDAEDAAQEVFLVVSRKLDTYDGTSAVTTWLYGITINVVRRARRRAYLRRFLEVRSDEPPEQAAPVEPDRVAVRQAHAIAYSVLDKLSDKHREVFVLSEFEGLSCEEIARVVDCKVETVWSRLHYARKEFARRLEKRGFGRSV